MSKMLRKENSARYYLSGAAGFFFSFITIVSPAAYIYKVHADELKIKRDVIPNPVVRPEMTTTALSMPPVSTISAVASKTPTVTVSVKEQLETTTTVPETVPAPLPSSPAKESPTAPAPSDEALISTNRATEPESEYRKRKAPYQEHPLAYKFQAGKVVNMEATAYCLHGVTASGVRSNYGIVAADPQLLPLGSIVRLYAGEYSGLYTVMDTGGKIKGRKIDVYLANSKEAIQFGRRKIAMEILRYGWNPHAIAPAQPPESESEETEKPADEQ